MNTVANTAEAKPLRKFPVGTTFVDDKVIMEVVSDFYNVPLSEIISGRRLRKVVIPRQVMMYLMVKHTKLTYKAIGEHFKADAYHMKKRKCEFKDHTTVIHSCESIQDLMDSDDGYYYEIKQLADKITSMHVKIKSEEKLEEVAKKTIHLLLNLRNAQKIYNDQPCFQARTSLRRWESMSDEFLEGISKDTQPEIA